jgi:hypothetical protein
VHIHHTRRRWIIRLAVLALVVAVVAVVLVLIDSSLHKTGGQQLVSIDQQVQEDAGKAIPHITGNGRRLLLLMIDGLAVKPFETLLADGRLPAIERLLQMRPSVSLRAISTFPSATSPAVPEFISGRYAEIDTLQAAGAVHAFDREERRVVRYVTQPDAWQWPIPTLFEAARELPAITVFEGRWDGPTAILTQLNLAWQAAFEAIGAEALSGGDRGPVEVFLNAVRGPRPPALSLVVLNEFDIAAHFHGPLSMQAQNALVNTDRLVGEIITTLENTAGADGRSMLDETSIILFGDHGSVESGQYVDLATFFIKRGIEAVDVSTVPHVMFRERLGTLWTEWPDAILVSGGSNVTQIYLRQASGSWGTRDTRSGGNARHALTRPDTVALAKVIAGVEGIGQVLWLDSDGSVQVLAADGSAARIQVREMAGAKGFAYIVDDDATADPFGYLGDLATAASVCRTSEINDACFLSRTQWFDRSFETRYPGAVALIPKAFQPQRYTGDLIVTLLPGYSFLRNQKGDHGNLERDAVLTPLIINGPGLAQCSETHRPRLVDIYPTAAVLLGADPDDPAFAGLDGRVLDCARGAAAR